MCVAILIMARILKDERLWNISVEEDSIHYIGTVISIMYIILYSVPSQQDVLP